MSHWTQAKTITRQTSVDRQLLGDLAALERDLVRDGLARARAQALITRVILTQYLIDRRIVSSDVLLSTTIRFDDASHAGGFTRYASRLVELIDQAVAATAG